MVVSIITINYNNLEGLKKTMKSVLEQTYGNIEYIVIDGGSTDGSKEYIEEHSESLAYWVSEPDKGIYNAMNKGIDKASGNYLLFLNSGDWLVDNGAIGEIEPERFQKDVISCNIQVIGGERDFIKCPPPEISFSYLFRDTLPHQSTFIKKSLFKKLGYYDENLTIVADWKFFILALCKFNATYGYIQKVISTFNLEGLSSQKENQINFKKERQIVLKKEFDVFTKDMKNLGDLKYKITNLRKSRWINLLIRLRLINKF